MGSSYSSSAFSTFMKTIHQAPPLISEPRLDELIASLGESAADILPQILAAFCNNFETRYVKLQLICRTRAQAELSEIVHDFKGLAQSIGWAALSNLCRDIRLQLQDHRFQDWETLPARLQILYTESLAETQKHLTRRHLNQAATVMSPPPSVHD